MSEQHIGNAVVIVILSALLLVLSAATGQPLGW